MTAGADKQIVEFSYSTRVSADELKHQRILLEQNPHISMLLNLMPQMCFILNESRQIVFCNDLGVKGLAYSSDEDILGIRFGEAVQCEHCDSHPGGCGTSLHCFYCNARKLTDARVKDPSQDTVKLTTKQGRILDVRIKQSVFNLGEENFSFVVIENISNEKRKERLEKIFFHDILNTAGVIRGYSEVLAIKNRESSGHLSHLLLNTSNGLIEEIRFQRDLILAEDDRLTSISKKLDFQDSLKEIVGRFVNEANKDKILIALDIDSSISDFYTDPTLFRRVMDNLLRNAIEASSSGDVIQVLASFDKGKIKIQVINPVVMESDVFMNLFKGAVSTKGKGRGLGVQSVKLLTERYLKGRVRCDSREGLGTVFTLYLPLKRSA